jgi:rhamnosyltransferase subunit B
MRHVILVGLGSSGDVNPLLGIAGALHVRGHRTTLLSAPQFRPAADSVGADFAPLGDAEEYERIYAHPDLWHPRRGLGVFFPYAAGLAGQTADLIEERYVPGETVVVATFQSFGARVAQEMLGVPVCTVLPNPILLQSAYDPNRNPMPNPPRWLGRGAIRLMYRLVNREVSRHSRHGINGARRDRGISRPVRDVVGWSYSPDLVLGLWPSLLSPRQPDWPRQARTAGFVAYDGPAAEGWTPPHGFPEGGNWLVFTPGTRMTHGAAFFRAACGAAAELGRPTVMVAGDRSLLPNPLPDNVWYLPYAPFTWLFSRADAVVHHGGIGTAGRALSAGLPQLIVPSGFDQFDNAARVTRAGGGLELHRKRLSSRSLLEALRRLLESEQIRGRCHAIRSELVQADPLTEVCLAVEDQMGA